MGWHGMACGNDDGPSGNGGTNARSPTGPRVIENGERDWRYIYMKWGRGLALVAAYAMAVFFGSAVGLLLRISHESFMSLWLGGALATPVGVLLAWLLARWRGYTRKPGGVSTLCWLGVISTATVGFAIFLEIPRLQEGQRRYELLQSLDAGEVKAIAIYDKYGERELRWITGAKDIAGFVSSCKDAKPWTPQHPRHSQSWYVVLEGQERLELIFSTLEGSPGVVVGKYVEKRGNVTRYYGAFRSRRLHTWLMSTLDKAGLWGRGYGDGAPKSP